MERKIFEFKGTMNDAGTIEGYGAVYGNRDLGNDILAPGSCTNVDEFVKTGSLMVGHAWGALPVATIDAAHQDDKGLFFKATYHSDGASQQARTVAAERLARGKFVGLSIGYATESAEQKQVDGVDCRYITKWAAFEISQVATPMNPLAGATAAKSFEDQYEEALTLLQLVVNRAQGIKTLREKDSRKLSDINMDRIKALAAATDGLLIPIKSILSEPVTGVSERELADARLAMARATAMQFGLI